MEIEFDPVKDQINQAKHSVSLAAAAEIDLGQAIVIEDRRFDYGEPRFIAYAAGGGRLHVLWFTRRGSVVRVIGLRGANRRERRQHARPG